MSSEYQDQFHNKILIAIFILFSVVYAEAELKRLEHPTKADGSFSFLVVGDWGRKGLYNQSAVARQMGIIGEKLDIDFVISTGDNFYKDGLTGVNDPAFDESFSNIYTARILGNHDYRGDVLAQLSHELTRRDGRWRCLRSYLLRSGFVEFFFVDTTPFIDEYFTNPEDHVYDWRGVLPRKTYVKNLLKDLDMALRHSTAKWKIVVAHHAIKSAGNPGGTVEVSKHLLPILEKHEVNLYINGHDHCLSHMTSENSPVQFLTSGGGSKAWKGDAIENNNNDLKFYYDGQGFMSAQVEKDKIHITFYDIYGNALHDQEFT